jgi:hypothetical protein
MEHQEQRNRKAADISSGLTESAYSEIFFSVNCTSRLKPLSAVVYPILLLRPCKASPDARGITTRQLQKSNCKPHLASSTAIGNANARSFEAFTFFSSTAPECHLDFNLNVTVAKI